jgi:adenylate cyclase
MKVFFQPDNLEVETNDDETILQASLKAGIPHTHACGGMARCSTCRVMVTEGSENLLPRNSKEQAMANKLHFTPDIRLACQTKFKGKIRLRRLVIDADDQELTDQFLAKNRNTCIGEEKHVVVMFTDIRGFTTFSEALPPYDVIHVLNRYFQQMGRVITRNGGYIDNYIGDGIMALFGFENPEDAEFKAVKAGLEMLEEMETFNPYLEALYNQRLEMGIGVHAGEAVVGSVGAVSNRKVTAIGDTVNFASRIESANKEAKTRFLISESTYEAVKDRIVIGKTVTMAIKGKSGTYNLYEVCGLTENALRD